MDQSLVREESSHNTGGSNSSGPTARRQMDFRTTSARLESSSLPLSQCGSSYVEQGAPTTPAAGTAVAQRRGGWIKTSRMTTSARLESSSLLSSIPPYWCWRVPEKPLLRMPHTYGSKMSSRFLKSRSRTSSPENKIINNFSLKVYMYKNGCMCLYFIGVSL